MASPQPHTAAGHIPVALELALIGLVLLAVIIATVAIAATPAS